MHYRIGLEEMLKFCHVPKVQKRDIDLTRPKIIKNKYIFNVLSQFRRILDGEKHICIDRLYPALQNGTCLVYSFGLADDWDFEIWMASLGK